MPLFLWSIPSADAVLDKSRKSACRRPFRARTEKNSKSTSSGENHGKLSNTALLKAVLSKTDIRLVNWCGGRESNPRTSARLDPESSAFDHLATPAQKA